jgi:hypothetical protein
MKNCPYCQVEINIKDIPHNGLMKDFRICPDCGGKFTVDKDTKYRQLFCLIFALIALLFTMLLYFGNNEFLIPAFISYIAIGVIVFRGNKKLYFVPYIKNDSQNDA